MTDGFQLEGQGPRAYERYLVPAFFGPCADELLELAAPAAGERVLDLACGTGVVARRLAERVGAAGAVAGVDINEQMVAFAASATEGHAPIEWHTADAARLPLAGASFAAVRILIASLLVRFPSPQAFLRQEVASSPLAGPVAGLGPDRLAGLARELDQVLAPYADDDGIALPMQTWLISARRQSRAG